MVNIVFFGPPGSGKGTIAKKVAQKLKVHWLDIDEIRVLNFGLPNPYPNTSEKSMELDRAEMKGSYELLYAATAINLQMQKSLIITATFSRSSYWGEVTKTLNKHPEYQCKIIWCKPLNDTEEEIRNRLKKRIFGVNCYSSVNSIERYREVKDRYEPIYVPHRELDTSPPNSIVICVNAAVNYIFS